MVGSDFGPPACVWSDVLPMANTVMPNYEQILNMSEAKERVQLHILRYVELDSMGPGSNLIQSVVCKAAKHGLLSICQWFSVYHFSMLYLWLDAFEEAAIHGHLHILQFLESLGITKTLTTDQSGVRRRKKVWRLATQRGHTHVSRWIIDHLNFTQNEWGMWTSDILDDCMDSRDLQFCQWMHAKFQFDANTIKNNDCAILKKAVRNNSLDICQWLVNTFKLTMDDVYHTIGDTAAHLGHFAICRWLIERLSQDNGFGPYFLRCSAGSGNLEQSRWLAARFKVTTEMLRERRHDVLYEACSSRDVPMCRWLVNHFWLTAKDLAILKSRDGCYLTEWLVENVVMTTGKP